MLSDEFLERVFLSRKWLVFYESGISTITIGRWSNNVKKLRITNPKCEKMSNHRQAKVVFAKELSQTLNMNMQFSVCSWNPSIVARTTLHTYSLQKLTDNFFFILRNMFPRSYVIFCCKCWMVVHLSFQCMHHYVIELRPKIYVNNLNIGIQWESRTARTHQQTRKQNLTLPEAPKQWYQKPLQQCQKCLGIARCNHWLL